MSKKVKGKKNKKWLIIIFVIIIVLVISICAKKFIFNDKKEVNNKKYLNVTSTKFDYKISNYSEGIFTVEKDNKQGYMNKNGNMIIDFKYDIFNGTFHDNRVVVKKDNKFYLIDKDENIKTKKEYTNIYVTGDLYNVSIDNKVGVIDKDGNEIVPVEYDYISFYKTYLIANKSYDNNFVDIYDMTGKKIFENKEISENHNANDNFIVFKENDKYKIYYSKTNRLSEEEYEYSFLNTNEIILNTDSKTIIKDSKEKTIKQFNEKYNEPRIISEKNISVLNNECSSEEYNRYLVLENGEEIEKGCNNIYNLNKYIVVDNKDNFNIYKGNKKISSTSKKENDYVFLTENNNISKQSEEETMLYDITGKRILQECKNVTEITKDYFYCSPITSYGYLMDKNGKYDKTKVYSSIYDNDGYILLHALDGKYGLIDKKGNILFDTRYDSINIYDNVLVANMGNKSLVKFIKYTNKKEKIKNEELSENENNTKDVNYDEISVDEIVKKYELSKLTNTINDNKEMFKKFAYHVTKNEKMNDTHKKYFLGLFQAIIDYSKYNDIEYLFDRIDKLVVEEYDVKPDDMVEGAAGQYNDSVENPKIYILKNQIKNALEHEFIHFISYSRTQKNNISFSNSIVYCDNKYTNMEDFKKFDLSKQNKCTQKYFTTHTFLEEAGAEYFSSYVYNNKPYKTYREIEKHYNLLLYLLKLNPKEIEYSIDRERLIYKALNEKYDYTFDDAEKLLSKIQSFTKDELEQYSKNLSEESYNIYSIFDNYIDMYKKEYNDDYHKNEFFIQILGVTIDHAFEEELNEYYKENPEAEKIKYMDDYRKIPYNLIPQNRVNKKYNIGMTSYLYNENNFYVAFELSNNFYSLSYDDGYLFLKYDEKGNYISEEVVK